MNVFWGYHPFEIIKSFAILLTSISKVFFLHAIIYLSNITRQKGQRDSFVLCLKSLNLGIMSKISSKILWKENVKLTMACFICIWKVQFTGVGGHFRWHWTWTSAVKLLIVDSKVRLTEVLLKMPLHIFFCWKLPKSSRNEKNSLVVFSNVYHFEYKPNSHTIDVHAHCMNRNKVLKQAMFMWLFYFTGFLAAKW